LKKGPSTIPILLLYPRSKARTPTVATQKTDVFLHSARHLSLMSGAALGPTPGQDWPRTPAPPLCFHRSSEPSQASIEEGIEGKAQESNRY
jgi:hypothetical protein